MKVVEAKDELGSSDSVKDDRSAEFDIVRRVASGDRAEFRHLVARYKDMIFSLALRQVGNRSIAEELAQEVFVKAYLNISRFRFESSFSTWLVRIAINHINSYFASKRYKQARNTESFVPERHDRDCESPETQLQRKERIRLFQAALAQLKPKFREAITLCGLEGKSYEEAARILKIPVGTVRSRLNKARLELKNAFVAQSLEERSNES